MTQPRKLAPTMYIPTGLYTLDGWPTLPETSIPVPGPGLFSQLGRTVSQFLFDTPRHKGFVPHRSTA
jgi:hypothetical protein